MNKNEIESLFDDWNRAIKTGDVSNVVSLYDDEAILLPTISDQVRYNHQEIEDYFIQFLDLGPQGKIDECSVRIFDYIAINSGIYTFSFKGSRKDSDQKSDNNSSKSSGKVSARFTFIYRKIGEHWKIIEHHSSQMPEQPKVTSTINS